METLDGTGRKVDLGQGISIQAAGLRGTADVHDVSSTSTTRAPDVDGSGPALERALARSDVHRIRVVTLDVAGAPLSVAGGTRTPTSDEDGIVVEVPDLGSDVAQVLFAVDEAGISTWNFPVDQHGSLAPTSRGHGDSVRFVVRATAPVPDGQGVNRGIMGALGHKVFELLTIPLAEHAVPPLARLAANSWESRARSTHVGAFGPAEYRAASLTDLDEAGWRSLAKGRSLWFVHGTFSTAKGGFGGIPADVMSALHQHYEGRVVAYEHLTLGVDPADNASTLADLAPSGLTLEADIVSHSRGGLVARALAGEGGARTPLDVRRVVHVATPNHGTALADPANISALLDRVTTLLNLAPDGPVDAVATSLAVILTVVKTIVRFGVPALPGLSAMDPAGPYLTALNSAAPTGAVHYAVASDYEPNGSVKRFTRGPVGDFVVDRVFGNVANDLVVPTAGVYDGTGNAEFPIDPARRLLMPKERAIDHSGYFHQSDVMQTIAGWLTKGG